MKGSESSALKLVIMKLKGLILLSSMSIAAASFAQAPAMDFSTYSTNGTAITSTRGYSFNVVEPNGILVTHLSFFDANSNGLAENHMVGLWDSAGNLLASSPISAGTVDALDATGKFRARAITPVLLAAGTNYTVGGTFNAGSADAQAISVIGLTMGTGITYGEARVANNGLSTLTMPTTGGFGFNGLPGGSFNFQAVPEPGTMIALGAGLLAFRRRRKA